MFVASCVDVGAYILTVCRSNLQRTFGDASASVYKEYYRNTTSIQQPFGALGSMQHVLYQSSTQKQESRYPLLDLILRMMVTTETLFFGWITDL